MRCRATARVESRRLEIARLHEDPFPPLQRQGRRRVYPYPMQDDLTDEMVEQAFTAVVLENGLLRATVLPELGGHVLSLLDLVHEREVFYPNVPLKLGLVALRGAWWAGGIEWNFPQVGHNVSTCDRVSWHVDEGADGSATVFVGTIERLTRMAWTVALSLRPDDWRLHVRVWTCNRTAFAHRSYFWSNAAVPARDDFRLLLPATEVYSWWYGADGAAPFPLSRGRDISRYTTHRRAADLFAKDLRADWFGCWYDELDCGVVHHASRFDVHGRKLFTWGTAGDGQVWAELLNARGEPYVEIQSGHFVHQGVHRLMAPCTVETWDESWAPAWGLGGVVHATDTLALSATRDGDQLVLPLLAFVPLEQARLTVRRGDRVLAQSTLAFASGQVHTVAAPLVGEEPVVVEVLPSRGEPLRVALRVAGATVGPTLDAPAPHTAVPDRPAEGTPTTPHGWLLRARDCEERNDLDAAADSYRKALDLDPQCVPALTGLAQWHLKRGEAARARGWATQALEVDLQSEDALWWLGVASMVEPGREEGASSHLLALRRSPRYAAAASARLGELALRRAEPLVALDLFDKAMALGLGGSRVRCLAAFAARLAGRQERARALLDQCERVNPLEPLLWSERLALDGAESPTVAAALDRVVGDDVQVALEAACDYEGVGAWAAAEAWLDAVARPQGQAAAHPMVLYHRALALWHGGKVGEAVALAAQPCGLSPSFVFPHRREDGQALETALRLAPDDPLAHLLLGTWLAAVGRCDEAMGHWRRTAQRAAAGELAVLAWRNIGLVTWLSKQHADEALDAYARALEALQAAAAGPGQPSLAPQAWRLWLERDTVLQARERHAERVALFERAPDSVKAKFQVQARWAAACLGAGRPAQALDILSGCHFKPWEGEGRSRQLWKRAHMQLGHQDRAGGDLGAAREHFEAAAEYPRHLGVGRPVWTDDADALFWAGWCALHSGDDAAARDLLSRAADEPQPRNASTAEFKDRAAILLRSLIPSGGTTP